MGVAGAADLLLVRSDAENRCRIRNMADTAQLSAGSIESPHFVRKATITRLFGNEGYSYDLSFEKHKKSNLVIVYGDNGCGKTTLLKLIFYLLAPTSGSGYKTFIASTPFELLSIELGDGVEISARKDPGRLIGPFTMTLTTHGTVIAQVYCKVEGESSVRPPSLGYESEFEIFLGRVAELRLDLFLITDDRQLLSSSSSSSSAAEASPENMLEDRAIFPFLKLRDSHRSDSRKSIDVALESALEIANQQIKLQILSGSQQGEADANTIYADIIERVLRPKPKSRSVRYSLSKLLQVLKEQSKRSNSFSNFGLPSPPQLDNLIELVASSGKKAPAVIDLMEPYVASLSARLDALQQVRDSISNLISSLNDFLTDKRASFDVAGGITITSTISENRMDPSSLSSGEKQLLLLFCNTLIARDRPALFIIDEPELSLNIKWQRQLIRALLTVSKGTPIQFLLATHSFHIFAQYESNVVELKPQLPSRKLSNGKVKSA